jgi:single-strand DNA-binding protein
MRPYAFHMFAVGRVAKQPELKQKGEHAYTSVCLVGNDYGGQDKEDVVTSLYFTAFDKTATALANNVRKGDQLVINGHVRNSNYTDSQTGEIMHSVSYIIDGFVFGAPGREKRDEFAGSSTASTDKAAEAPIERRRRRARNG